MADKNSTYISEFENGTTVDEILSRAAPNGAIDKALSNKDPANWGIGTIVAKGTSDADGCIEGGMYYWGSAAVNTPFGSGNMLVVPRSKSTVQIGFEESNKLFTHIAIRKRVDGVFGPWECINPPMLLGVEYRTTERWTDPNTGKTYPVYVKAVSFGALPNLTGKKVSIDDQNRARAIRVSGVLSNGITIPGTDESQVDNSKPIQCYGYNNNVVIYAPYDASSKTAVVTAWYYKTTD